jgi:hypothetical protein
MLSEKAATIINAKLNQCWENAYYALHQVPELEQAWYIEGWSIREAIPFPFEHGWLVLGNQIVDPTRVLWKKANDEVSYFPATRLRAAHIDIHVTEALHLPLMPHLCRIPSTGNPYQRALENALAALK